MYAHIPLVWVSYQIISNFSQELHPILGDFVRRYGNLEVPNLYYSYWRMALVRDFQGLLWQEWRSQGIRST